jgi:hypothetical protein
MRHTTRSHRFPRRSRVLLALLASSAALVLAQGGFEGPTTFKAKDCRPPS